MLFFQFPPTVYSFMKYGIHYEIIRYPCGSYFIKSNGVRDKTSGRYLSLHFPDEFKILRDKAGVRQYTY